MRFTITRLDPWAERLAAQCWRDRYEFDIEGRSIRLIGLILLPPEEAIV
jgi:hypothetical protein